MTIRFGHVMCPSTEEEFIFKEKFFLQYIIINLEYYKVVVKGLSDKGPDIYKEF